MSLPAAEDLNVEAEDPKSRLGETLEDRYRIDAVLGVGAMGCVYRARHLSLRKDVAVKLLHRQMTVNAEVVARFDREAAGASRLDHPNCVRVMDFGRTETGHSFLVMELLDGHDVASMIDSASVPLHRTVEIIAQVLAGLDHAHKQGVIHRDLKPENIFLNRNPDGAMVAKIVDFGIAKVEHGEGSTTLTKAGMVFGTPQYMSPEQALGRPVDARTDLYSLGLVMHAMLTGDLPFDGDDPVAILKAQVKEEPPELPDEIPEKVRAFIKKMTAKEPDDRFPDAATALDVLKQSVTFTTPTKNATQAQLTPPNLGGVGTGAISSPDGVEGAKQAVLVAGQRVRVKAGEIWSRVPTQWRVPVMAGAGILGVVGLVAALTSSGDQHDDSTAAKGSRVAAVDADAGDDASPDAEGGGGAEVVIEDDEETAEAPAKKTGTPGSPIRTTLATVDELIATKKFDSARITLENWIKDNPDEADLHLRMAQVLMSIRARSNQEKLDNARLALESYAKAIELRGSVLEDEQVSESFYALLDRPEFRARAVEIAIALLGEDGLERVANWVNVQKNPLPFQQRHVAMKHLRDNGQADWINVPLQAALDLWQAPSAEDPCAAFSAALRIADQQPDSFLAGTIDTVPIPNRPDGQQCDDIPVELAKVQVKYLAAYAGLKSEVPEAYRKQVRKR